MIAIENVTKYYGSHAAVRDLTMSIPDGQVVGLLGLNGAGKSTTLGILSGLIIPTSGRVMVAGLDMSKDPEAVRARVGYLPEKPPLYLEMTVEGYLTFVARIKGYAGNLKAALDEALTVTDLVDVRRDVIGTLSHGYQKRVGIAQAIIHKPALILLDEPSSGLDPVQVVHMRRLIKGLRGQNTILVSSHILGEIHELCDRIFVLQDGRIMAEGTEDQLAGRVAQTTAVSVEVRCAADALAQVLSKTNKVARHTIEREEQGITYARVELVSDEREDLARSLVQAGFGLRRLERVRLELEGIFLQLTGKDARETPPKDDAAQGGPRTGTRSDTAAAAGPSGAATSTSTGANASAASRAARPESSDRDARAARVEAQS